MATVIAPSDVAALEAVHEPVDDLLDAFFAARIAELGDLDPAVREIGTQIAAFVQAGGKRLRPAFVYWGYRATGAPHDDAVFAPAAAVELLHNFALIHDDVMDRSASRRGQPAVHRALAAVHHADELLGDSDWFGIGGAILAGDLTFVWADALLDGAALSVEALARARAVFTRLRVEVMAGQYLDLRLAGTPDVDVEYALRVALLKSGRYTVTRPLQLGSAIGGGDDVLAAALAAFGDAVGVAFQLRDDVLGLFGDPETTGKGALDDLREGKRTVLILTALSRCNRAERAVIDAALGDPELDAEEADAVRQIVLDSGALTVIEQRLATQQSAARGALAPVEEPAAAALAELAELAAFRVI